VKVEAPTPETVDKPEAEPTEAAKLSPTACAVDVPSADPTPANIEAPTAATVQAPEASPTPAEKADVSVNGPEIGPEEIGAEEMPIQSANLYFLKRLRWQSH